MNAILRAYKISNFTVNSFMFISVTHDSCAGSRWKNNVFFCLLFVIVWLFSGNFYFIFLSFCFYMILSFVTRMHSKWSVSLQTHVEFCLKEKLRLKLENINSHWNAINQTYLRPSVCLTHGMSILYWNKIL